jgi:hypothetical protein
MKQLDGIITFGGYIYNSINVLQGEDYCSFLSFTSQSAGKPMWSKLISEKYNAINFFNLSYISSFHLFTSGYNAFSANTAPNKRLSALFLRSGKLAGIAVKMRKYSRP